MCGVIASFMSNSYAAIFVINLEIVTQDCFVPLNEFWNFVATNSRAQSNIIDSTIYWQFLDNAGKLNGWRISQKMFKLDSFQKVIYLHIPIGAARGLNRV